MKDKRLVRSGVTIGLFALILALLPYAGLPYHPMRMGTVRANENQPTLMSMLYAYLPTILVMDKSAMTLQAPSAQPADAPTDSQAPLTPSQLQARIERLAKRWEGVAGVSVYDLASGQEIAGVNQHSVFSAASTIKVAIMLNAYIHIKTFDNRQEAALQKMIVDSDNLAANSLLAAAAGQIGIEAELAGAEQMNALLTDLGLAHTYMRVPFDATDDLTRHENTLKLGPERDGEEPYTAAGRALRTSPAEVAQLYLYIDQCSKGKGVLVRKFASRLTPARCQEMLDRLATNGDHQRIPAGIPAGVRVEHKSGWIDDMQADAGIVRSPGGDFLLAIYLYRDNGSSAAPLPDTLFTPTIASFARLVYDYYNPPPTR